MGISGKSINKLVITVIMAVLFFSMAPSLVYTLGTKVVEFLTMISGNTTTFGAGPSAIATVVANNWGYFLVAGLVMLIITVIGGLFYVKRRR